MTRKAISVALQGGGSHGAFTWGVLDRLLEDDRIHIEAISGTSAGAMNAAALLSGYARGGASGARESLNKFWLAISDYAAFSPMQRSWIDQVMGNWSLQNSPGYLWANWFGNLVSPYQSNPFNLSPLRSVLNKYIDIEALRSCSNIRIFVAATNVRTGKAKIFDRDSLSIDALLASACLPHLYQAVEIEGEAYWDGGYMGNPVIWPLIYKAETADVVLIQINPLTREQTPTSVDDINDRRDEITFNSSLIHEMRAIAFVQRLLDQGALKEPWSSQYKNMRMHMISDPQGMEDLGASSKMNVEHSFVMHLKSMGYQTANNWIKSNISKIGKSSTLDIRSTFL